MIPAAALKAVALDIAAEMEGGAPSAVLMRIGEALSAQDGVLEQVVGLLARETLKKRPDDSLAAAYAFMLGQALEVVRYGVERGLADSVAQAEAVRARIRALLAEGKIGGPGLLIVLSQFAEAKLDPGDDLREAMMRSAGLEAETGEPGVRRRGRAAGGGREAGFPPAPPGMFEELARVTGGDPFVIHAELSRQGSVFPDRDREGMVAALMSAPQAPLREASLGWLLDEGPLTRRATADLLRRASAEGGVSPVMLRRMIMMRNWIPEAERAGLDAAIQAARQAGIDCAPMPGAVIKSVQASPVDGSGARSVIAVVKDGRKQAAAAMLLKLDKGVRDAWVQPGLPRREVAGLLGGVSAAAALCDIRLEDLELMLAHHLAISLATGVLPGFGLLAVVERLGLAAANAKFIPLDALIGRALAGLTEARADGPAVDRALRASGDWPETLPIAHAWFEVDGELSIALGRGRLSRKRRVALVLETFLPGRRGWWAEVIAWTALALRGQSPDAQVWADLALVAREIHHGRPLAEIPIMIAIAEGTVQAWEARG